MEDLAGRFASYTSGRVRGDALRQHALEGAQRRVIVGPDDAGDPRDFREILDDRLLLGH
jgi:hypothetical protein